MVDENDPTTWGENYCYAPQRVQDGMRELVYQFELENTEARLEQVRQGLRKRGFFHGRQVIYWSQTEFRYKVPSQDELSEEEYSDLELISNIYQGYVLITMAELSQSPPRTAFMPESPEVRPDVELAHRADHI